MSSEFKPKVHIHIVIVLFLCLTCSQSGRIRRIVRGTPVPCGIQARVASLQNSTSKLHLCGAVVITPKYALTAAHCVEKPSDQYVLQLRNFCIGDNETYPEARVVNIITNEKYNRFTGAHDLSILEITLELETSWLNDSVLPTSSFGLSSDDCVIYGYGTTNPNSVDTSETLLAGRVETMSLDECISRLGPYVAPGYDDGMMCAMGDKADACQGDSGGPLICKDSTLQGISSYGQSCGVNGVPGVYTSIGAHLRWINAVITRPSRHSHATHAE